MSRHEGMARLEKAIKDAPTGASGPGEVRISWSDATAILALLQHPEEPSEPVAWMIVRVPHSGVGTRVTLYTKEAKDFADRGYNVVPLYRRSPHRVQ